MSPDKDKTHPRLKYSTELYRLTVSSEWLALVISLRKLYLFFRKTWTKNLLEALSSTKFLFSYSVFKTMKRKWDYQRILLLTDPFCRQVWKPSAVYKYMNPQWIKHCPSEKSSCSSRCVHTHDTTKPAVSSGKGLTAERRGAMFRAWCSEFYGNLAVAGQTGDSKEPQHYRKVIPSLFRNGYT